MVQESEFKVRSLGFRVRSQMLSVVRAAYEALRYHFRYLHRTTFWGTV